MEGKISSLRYFHKGYDGSYDGRSELGAVVGRHLYRNTGGILGLGKVVWCVFWKGFGTILMLNLEDGQRYEWFCIFATYVKIYLVGNDICG